MNSPYSPLALGGSGTSNCGIQGFHKCIHEIAGQKIAPVEYNTDPTQVKPARGAAIFADIWSYPHTKTATVLVVSLPSLVH